MVVRKFFPGGAYKGETQWPQIMAILIGSLAGLTEGLLFAWSSPFLIKITQDKVNYDISEEQASYFVTIQALAISFCCPIFPYLCDRIGRKKTLMLISIPQVLSWILAAVAKNVYVFYVARALAGMGNACFYSAFAIYIGEVANPTVRGTYGNSIAFTFYLGDFLIAVIGSYWSVQLTSYVCVTIPILFLILFSFMPESPYWLVMKGREEEAKKSLKFLKRKEHVNEDYIQLNKDVERQMSDKKGLKSLVKTKSSRKGLLACIFLRFSQQLGGLNVFMAYTQFIFQKSGSFLTETQGAQIYTFLNFAFNIIVSMFVVDRLGRRKGYITSLLATAVILFTMATYFYLDGNTDVDVSSFNWIPLAGMVLYLVFSSFGMAVIPTLMLGEVFSARQKANAITILIFVLGIASFASNQLFYYLNSHVGFYFPFYFFCACNILSSIIAYAIVPETKGKTLEEIQEDLRGCDEKPKKVDGEDKI
ncbi:facilitated trehalose transporter Tret1-like [Diabrotica virgifera virgifera]|uniref:Major facilitator superfamily (MFS) profile domain-containing protein n=1 Tax=Diabrotica virgifera virgifera TaxID=50390 RepID=A0ABM5JJW1_DIAVI|nr:facilitated trehalose transporter Tret1-like [Diabrotica virgifera virgifera]